MVSFEEFTNISSTNEKFIVYNTTDVNETISNFMNSEETTKSLAFNNNHYVGFKYPLKDHTLVFEQSLAISNELEAEEGIISFSEGKLLLIESRD